MTGPQPAVGFPEEALDFYEDLEDDNTKRYWDEHLPIYRRAVQAPMKALAAALEPRFGPAKIFRPNRDVRFSADKTPYKTHQGLFVQAAPASGWYLEFSAAGVRLGGGFYHADSAGLAAYREAVQSRRGAALAKLIGELAGGGWEITGDRLKTAPRGIDAAHPRIELLRHKSLTAMRHLGHDPVIHGPELTERVLGHWEELRPLVDWLVRTLPSE